MKLLITYTVHYANVKTGELVQDDIPKITIPEADLF
jgi:hypothetical protein